MSRNVIVVDDDKIFLEELSEILLLSGYDVVPVDDPEKVPELVQSLKPSAVLLDIKMPGKSGFEVAHEIRNLPEGANIPIIAMSGFFQEGVPPLVKFCDINAFLKKPFNPLDVIHMIEATLLGFRNV